MAHGFSQEDIDRIVASRQMPQQAVQNGAGATNASAGTLSKHRSRKALVDGITFDSEKEARRYQELKLLERVGAIRDLELQPPFDCYGANGERICGYRGDFRYYSVELGRIILEDAKSEWTRRLPVYRLKMKLLRAQGVVITEV